MLIKILLLAKLIIRGHFAGLMYWPAFMIVRGMFEIKPEMYLIEYQFRLKQTNLAVCYLNVAFIQKDVWSMSISTTPPPLLNAILVLS